MVGSPRCSDAYDNYYFYTWFFCRKEEMVMEIIVALVAIGVLILGFYVLNKLFGGDDDDFNNVGF